MIYKDAGFMSPKAGSPVTTVEKKNQCKSNQSPTYTHSLKPKHNPMVVDWFNHKYPGVLVFRLLVYTAEMGWLRGLASARNEENYEGRAVTCSEVV